MKNPTKKAPAHLRPDTKAWWLHVHAGWRLEEHHSRLLTMAAEAWTAHARPVKSWRRMVSSSVAVRLR